MDMNTMNLVTTDLTALNSTEIEAWFADAGLPVTEVSHCATADCPVCFPFEAAMTVATGPLNMDPLAA
jgi:hypothetical protein